MEVTKKQAAEILGVSQKEIVRMIDRGELKAHKKTESKFSDFLITVPDRAAERKKITKAISTEIKDKAKRRTLATYVKPKARQRLEEESEPDINEVIEQEIKDKAESEPESEPEPEPEPELEPESGPELEKPEVEVREKVGRRRRLFQERTKEREKNDQKERENRWWFGRY